MHQGNQAGETRGDRSAEIGKHLFSKSVVHPSSVWTSSLPPVSRHFRKSVISRPQREDRSPRP